MTTRLFYKLLAAAALGVLGAFLLFGFTDPHRPLNTGDTLECTGSLDEVGVIRTTCTFKG